MVIGFYQCVLQAVNRSDRDVFPLWCMFDMSSSETPILYTKLDPLSALPGGCVLFLHRTMADKEGCLEDSFYFVCPKTKRRGETESTKPISPILSEQLSR